MSAIEGYGNRELQSTFSHYALMVIIFNGLLAIGIGQDGRSNAEWSTKDLILFGAATHKVSRIITRDVVTSPFRAPLTRYLEELGYGEIKERSRRSGMAGSIGDVLSCQYCADPWVALGLYFGLIHAPKSTRAVLRFFSSLAIADHLHVLYESVRSRTNVLTLREHALEKKVS